MKTDRAERIAILILCIMGLALFVWSWSASGSFLAAVVITLVGSFFAVLFAGPMIALIAFALDLLLSLVAWLATRPQSARPRA